MKTIIYECGLPNTLSGGFGDRLIGIISCLALCEYTGAKLFISWNDTPLYNYFDYPTITSEFTDYLFCSHYLSELQDIFQGKTPLQIAQLFPNDVLRFNTNQNLWQFLAVDEPYEAYTRRLFKKVFTSILKPKPQLNEIVQQFSKQQCVGIQLRFGDVVMNAEREQINSPHNDHFPLGNNLNAITSTLHSIIQANINETIFITSDIDISKFINLSMYPNITKYDKPSVHIERSINKDGLDKCFVDFLVLCQCKKLYITAESNFGRCPGIISGAPVFKINSNLQVTECGVKYMACKHI
jgi:hypothetical protein